MKYTFGPYLLDGSLPLLTKEGQTVAVPPRALAALLLLVERRHTACTRAELVATVWPDSFVEEGSLAQLISTLRKALASGFPDKSPIQTITKVGYRFVAEVQEYLPASADMSRVDDVANIAVQPSPAAEDLASVLDSRRPVPSVRHDVLWRPRLAVFGCAVLLSVLVVAGFAARPRRVPPPMGSNSGRGAVAVLPFHSVRGESTDAWIGIAIQEMLSTDLRLSTSARVLPTDEVQRAALESHVESAEPGGADMQRLARDLDCDLAVAGTYSVHGGRIELRFRTYQIGTGLKGQERVYDRPEAAFLPMLAEAGLQAGRDLGTSVVDNGKAYALANRLRPDMYAWYAKGVAANRIYQGRDAVGSLEHAVALDPGFSLAHLELSAAWSGLGEESKAMDEAKRAFALSGQLTREQQLLIQARVQSTGHQFASAADTYRALYRFYPENQEYGGLLIQALSNAGRGDDALQEAQQMLASNRGGPTNPLLFSVLADMYSTRGEWGKSLEWATRGAEESRARGAIILYERLLTTESQAMLHLHQLPAARAKTEEALALARQYQDISGELRALNRTGEIATAQHDNARAESALLAALDLEKSHDQVQREVHTLLNLSRLSQAENRLPMSLAYGERAQELAKRLGQAEVSTEAKLQVGTVKAAMGAREDAGALLAEARDEAAEIHDSYLQQAAQQVIVGLRRAN